MHVFWREAREAAGFSQTEVAETLGFKPQFVSNWERNMSRPPLPIVKKLIKLYRLDGEVVVQNMLNEERTRLEAGLRGKPYRRHRVSGKKDGGLRLVASRVRREQSHRASV